MQKCFAFVLLLSPMLILQAGCSSFHSPTTVPAKSQYTISGGVESAGVRPLHPGETISDVLREVHPQQLGEPMTVVLVRRGPEGRTRRLIQVDATGKVMDPKQNCTLLDGDEIIFPGSGAANPPARAVTNNP